MLMMTLYVEVAGAIELHRQFMEGADAYLIRQETLLAVGISQNQPFVDGNKRTAIVVADVFLRINGHVYAGEPIELAKQLEAVAERSDSLDAATDRFENWLRKNTQPHSR
jgi:prophage maintenance system killer protein